MLLTLVMPTLIIGFTELLLVKWQVFSLPFLWVIIFYLNKTLLSPFKRKYFVAIKINNCTHLYPGVGYMNTKYND